MEILLKICDTAMTVLGALYAYQVLYIVFGLFFTRKFAPAKRFHKYAVVVSARNEEAVIGNLIDSINKQDYPKDKITVFVVADNCKDNTAQIARKYGAVCYERFDTEHCTKGYALQYLFENIQRDYGTDSFEAYIVFDADNLLKRDFISRMNDAFDSGERVITSYRNTKNLDANFISAGYGFHWIRTSRFTSRARSFLGVTTWVQGCGFMFASEFVKDGWNFTSLTEDRAFSVDVVSKGYGICYQHEAQFYDEQPTNMKIVMRQRIRWAKGHLQAFAEYYGVLIKGIFAQKGFVRRFNCYDMLVTMMPYCVAFIPLKILKYIASSAVLLVGAVGLEALKIIPMFFEIMIFEHLGMIPMALFLFVLEYSRLEKIKWYKAIFYSLMFPLFGIVGDVSTWIALFTDVTWKPIPHNASVDIEKMESKVLALKK